MHTGSSSKNNSSGSVSPQVNLKWEENQHLTPLKTKLYVPPLRSSWITRLRLVKRLDEGFKGKLTLISAPAGFGKTTLLVDWLHKYKIPVAWFSLDKADNDPLHFLTYVILGLQGQGAVTGKAALAMLQSPQPPPIESILINLINDVIRIPTDMALVLDDYHLIDARSIHDLIAFLLKNLPQQMHLIIATRSDPPLPLARLRSQNLLTESRAADLSFTADETADLFNQNLNLGLSTKDIHLLEARTEGWIAGLQLAALSLQGRKDPSDFISRFKGDNRYIADYLTEEVLTRQPEDLRNFLLQTSILGCLSGPLCDAVTRQQDDEQILNTLEKANLFVIPLDDERCWYRYHHLFADLLEQRLRVNQSDLIPELHRRASQWFAQKGTERMNNYQSKKKPVFKFLFIGCGTMTILVVAMIIGVGVWLFSGPEDIEMTAYHPFRSTTAKEQYLKLYDKRAKKWPVDSQTRSVDTSYGQTFVRMSGPVGAPPLVLLHGAGGNSLQWMPNIEALSQRYRVYAVDNIYDYGRSIYTKIIKGPDDIVNWLDELFNALELGNNINLIGLSYGGWLTSQYALRFPDRLAKIVLLAPAGTVLPIRLEWIMRAVLCLVPHRYFTKSFMYWLLEDLATKDEASRIILDEEVDATLVRIRSFKPSRLVNPTVLADEELNNIKVPALYLVGEHEKIYSAQKAIQRLHKVAPHIEAEVIPNAGHDLTIVQAELVNTKVLGFLKQL